MTQRVTNQIVCTRRELTSESYPLSSTPTPWHVPPLSHTVGRDIKQRATHSDIPYGFHSNPRISFSLSPLLCFKLLGSNDPLASASWVLGLQACSIYIRGKGEKRPNCVLSVLSVRVHSYNLYIPLYSSYLAKNKASETFADYWPAHDGIIYWLEDGGITSGLSSIPLLVDFYIIYFPHMCVGAHMLWHKCGQRTTCGSWFAPATWVPGIELRLLSLLGSTFNLLSHLAGINTPFKKGLFYFYF